MPSIEAPTHYERSVGIAPNKFDHFFRWSVTEPIEDTGHVESSLGWVGLVKVDEELIASYLENDPWVSETPPHGWYIVRQDNNGLVWGIEYGPDATLNEEKARADFKEAVEVYAEWLDEDELPELKIGPSAIKLCPDCREAYNYTDGHICTL
jgi:hypothetical protein